MKLNCREQSQDRTFYYQKLFCCDNYEDHNGRCERMYLINNVFQESFVSLFLIFVILVALVNKVDSI